MQNNQQLLGHINNKHISWQATIPRYKRILSQRTRYKKEVLKEETGVLTKQNSSQESIGKNGSK
jgi:hypothetical protein